MNIRVDLNYPIKDGTEVVFRSPVDCSQVTGLKVYYIDGDGIASSNEFHFADAHGNNVGDIDHLFAENVAVKVILDVTTGMAFVQNADTNAYLEGRFSEIEAKMENPGGITDEELADKVTEIITADVDEWGSIADAIENVAEYSASWVAEMMMSQHDLLLYDEDNQEYIRNVPTVGELDEAIGNIESAIDSIIAIQTQLIGGDSV